MENAIQTITPLTLSLSKGLNDQVWLESFGYLPRHLNPEFILSMLKVQAQGERNSDQFVFGGFLQT
ncbi:MAG: hypothetical protein M1549_01820 [Candidatus Dependentiae bacterium]|nr:hypothetical protein [Candidatus Dependentiae bacterium]